MANGFISTEHTELLQKLVKEIVNDPTTYIGSRYLPSVALPVDVVRTEVIEASGGLTNEHVIGTDPLYINSFGTRVQEYKPPKYKESIHYDEDRILFLRQLGQNGRNERGIRQYIDIDVDRLNRRLEARIELQRWDTIFSGGFSYQGKTISFGIPAGNRAVPISAVWSSDGVSANNSSDPIKDLRYWIMGGLAAWRKYTVTKIVMNQNTARWILDNTNTRSYVESFGANQNISNFELNKVLQFLLPGIPEVEIYKGWYQTESVNGSGKIVVSDAIFFIPDGYIFMETSLPGNDRIGEFVQTIHLAEGSIDQPGYGKFLVVEDCTLPGTKGGPKNPYLDLVSGVYGGVKLDRSFDVLTAKVIA